MADEFGFASVDNAISFEKHENGLSQEEDSPQVETEESPEEIVRVLPTLRECTVRLQKLGLCVWQCGINAGDVGVPLVQCRRCRLWCHEQCLNLPPAATMRPSAGLLYLCPVCLRELAPLWILPNDTEEQGDFRQVCLDSMAKALGVGRAMMDRNLVWMFGANSGSASRKRGVWIESDGLADAPGPLAQVQHVAAKNKAARNKGWRPTVRWDVLRHRRRIALDHCYLTSGKPSAQTTRFLGCPRRTSPAIDPVEDWNLSDSSSSSTTTSSSSSSDGRTDNQPQTKRLGLPSAGTSEIINRRLPWPKGLTTWKPKINFVPAAKRADKQISSWRKTKTAEPLSLERIQEIRNSLEQKRRDRDLSHLERLRLLLPELKDTLRASKIRIVRSATAYIAELDADFLRLQRMRQYQRDLLAKLNLTLQRTMALGSGEDVAGHASRNVDPLPPLKKPNVHKVKTRKPKLEDSTDSIKMFRLVRRKTIDWIEAFTTGSHLTDANTGRPLSEIVIHQNGASITFDLVSENAKSPFCLIGHSKEQCKRVTPAAAKQPISRTPSVCSEVKLPDVTLLNSFIDSGTVAEDYEHPGVTECVNSVVGIDSMTGNPAFGDTAPYLFAADIDGRCVSPITSDPLNVEPYYWSPLNMVEVNMS